MWLTSNGVLELHGKEKLSWTQLDEHIFRRNIPAEELRWKQSKWINEVGWGIGNRLVFHFLSAEGDLKDTAEIASGGSFSDVQAWFLKHLQYTLCTDKLYTPNRTVFYLEGKALLLSTKRENHFVNLIILDHFFVISQ